MAKPSGGATVRSKKLIPEHMVEVADAATYVRLNFWPTGPWATRALMEHVLPRDAIASALVSASDPCCGLGHMADVLREYFGLVFASDIHCYGFDHVILDFLSDDAPAALGADWIIINPPFDQVADFIERALELARCGVAVLARHAIVEGGDRYERIWQRTPPRIVAPFSERLSMCCGGWDPDLAGNVPHAWFVWTRNADGSWPTTEQVGHGQQRIIPPGREKALTRPGDELLAARHLPGWIAPSKFRTRRRAKRRRRVR